MARRATNKVSAFTLIELLTVIAIIGIIAAIAIPNLQSFKPNVMAAGTSQLLGDVARARQLAISQRTTVYMVFVPTNLPNIPACESVMNKQMIGYTFVSLRRLGDQPGRGSPQYLSEWRTLPSGVIIASDKFGSRDIVTRTVTNNANEPLEFRGFEKTVSQNELQVPPIPFPVSTVSNVNVNLPYIAFNHLGQLVSGKDEIIPLALGSVGFSRDSSGKVIGGVNPVENPPNNAVDTYNIVRIDWLTGRARVERQEIR